MEMRKVSSREGKDLAKYIMVFMFPQHTCVIVLAYDVNVNYVSKNTFEAYK